MEAHRWHAESAPQPALPPVRLRQGAPCRRAWHDVRALGLEVKVLLPAALHLTLEHPGAPVGTRIEEHRVHVTRFDLPAGEEVRVEGIGRDGVLDGENRLNWEIARDGGNVSVPEANGHSANEIRGIPLCTLACLCSYPQCPPARKETSARMPVRPYVRTGRSA